ncbi:MAG: Polyphosphate kinase, partial [uncultured Blastococcus sp.]
ERRRRAACATAHPDVRRRQRPGRRGRPLHRLRGPARRGRGLDLAERHRWSGRRHVRRQQRAQPATRRAAVHLRGGTRPDRGAHLPTGAGPGPARPGRGALAGVPRRGAAVGGRGGLRLAGLDRRPADRRTGPVPAARRAAGRDCALPGARGGPARGPAVAGADQLRCLSAAPRGCRRAGRAPLRRTGRRLPRHRDADGGDGHRPRGGTPAAAGASRRPGPDGGGGGGDPAGAPTAAGSGGLVRRRQRTAL